MKMCFLEIRGSGLEFLVQCGQKGEHLLFNGGITSSSRRSVSIYAFHIRALRNIYTYLANQQIHTDKICFILY